MEIVDSTSLSYIVSVPTSKKLNNKKRDIPILCFLHGTGESKEAQINIKEALTRHGPLRTGNSQNIIDSFIIIALQKPTREDNWISYAKEICEIIKKVRKEYGGNSKQQYLTGFSYGGNGVLEIAASEPSFWTALWPVDPTRLPKVENYPKCPIWFSMGEYSRIYKAEFIKYLDLKAISEDDYGNSIYHDANLDHVPTATDAYNDERIYNWLQTKVR